MKERLPELARTCYHAVMLGALRMITNGVTHYLTYSNLTQ